MLLRHVSKALTEHTYQGMRESRECKMTVSSPTLQYTIPPGLPIRVEGTQRDSREGKPIRVEVQVQVDRETEVFSVDNSKLPVHEAKGEEEEDRPEGSLHLVLLRTDQADGPVNGGVVTKKLEEFLVGTEELYKTLTVVIFLLFLLWLHLHLLLFCLLFETFYPLAFWLIFNIHGYH